MYGNNLGFLVITLSSLSELELWLLLPDILPLALCEELPVGRHAEGKPERGHSGSAVP